MVVGDGNWIADPGYTSIINLTLPGRGSAA